MAVSYHTPVISTTGSALHQHHLSVLAFDLWHWHQRPELPGCWTPIVLLVLLTLRCRRLPLKIWLALAVALKQSTVMPIGYDFRMIAFPAPSLSDYRLSKASLVRQTVEALASNARDHMHELHDRRCLCNRVSARTNAEQPHLTSLPLRSNRRCCSR